MAKEYLDYAGLKEYDTKIKEYIRNYAASADVSELLADITDLQNMDATLVGELNALKALVGNTAVEDQISNAISELVNGAPEALDTLKEISDWIETHGTAAADLVEIVAEQGQAIKQLSGEYEGITAIDNVYIDALFLDPVYLEENQTVQDAFANLEEGQKLVLTNDVDEDLIFANGGVIEAEGVAFNGDITVNTNEEVVIIGATFNGEVHVANNQ